MHRLPARISTWSVATAIGLWLCACPQAHAACDVSLIYPVRPNAGLLVFPGITNYFVTATNPDVWRLAWIGQGGVVNFNGRVHDLGGGALIVASSTITEYSQPTPNEIVFNSNWDAASEVGPDRIDFISSSPTIILELRSNSTFFLITYVKPNNTEGSPTTNPFGTTFNATGGAVANPPTVHCDGFETL